jgi:hypothetical protein
MWAVSERRAKSDADDVIGRHLEAIGGDRHFAMRARAWTVREVIDPITLTRVLIFDCDGTARRVRHYPVDWRELSDEALYTLSWSS